MHRAFRTQLCDQIPQVCSSLAKTLQTTSNKSRTGKTVSVKSRGNFAFSDIIITGTRLEKEGMRPIRKAGKTSRTGGNHRYQEPEGRTCRYNRGQTANIADRKWDIPAIPRDKPPSIRKKQNPMIDTRLAIFVYTGL
ncbi:hypothetical protein B0H13DRAFT_1863880 [Mycena leptocephala]|nr:hypothetical protein B0H13DRAFT_1863880 [Mycena leptocephala]